MKKYVCYISLVFLFPLGGVGGSSLFAQPRTLSLNDCLEMALQQSASLQIKQQETKVAEDKRKEAKSAYFPKIDGSLSYIHMSDEMYLLSEDKFLPIGTKKPDGSFGFNMDQIKTTTIDGKQVPVDANGQPFNPKTHPEKIQWNEYTTIPREELAVDLRNTFVGGVSLVQPIYMGGRIYHSNKMAAIGADIAKEQENMERAEVLFNVEKTYWLVISLQDKLKTAEEYRKLLNKLYSDVTALQDEGMAVKADVLKVRVKLNEVNINCTKVANGLSLARMSLCQHIGLPPTATIQLIDEQPPVQQTKQQATDINAAYNNRGEIKSLEKFIDVSKHKEKIALAGYLPEVGLMANYMFYNPDFFNGFQKTFSGSWNVGVAMKIPILHWGEHTSKMHAAKRQTAIAEIKLNDARTQIELQLNQAAFKVEESDKQWVLAADNFEQAEENLKYAKTAYDEGLVGVTDLLEAQASWYAAYSEKKDAEINLEMNQLYLKKATGLLSRETLNVKR